MSDYKNQVESILFASGRFMDIETIMNLLEVSDKKLIKQSIGKLQKEYIERESPLMIVEEKNGWKITVRETYLPLVRKIVADTELPKTVLETLAVIAWSAPILQSKVVDIRHNKAYEHIALLEELGFVGKEKTGRSFLLKLTEKFFNYFEVDGKQDLRKLFKDIKDEKILQLEKKKQTLPETGAVVVGEQEQDDTKEQAEQPTSQEEKAIHQTEQSIVQQQENPHTTDSEDLASQDQESEQNDSVGQPGSEETTEEEITPDTDEIEKEVYEELETKDTVNKEEATNVNNSKSVR